jgi:hypothetical protein
LEKEDKLELPFYPRVEVRGNAVIIIEEDGEEHLWGLEDDESIAVAIAGEIQLGLRAIKYVRTCLLKSLREAMEFLMLAGVPTEQLDDIIFEGYCSIHKWFVELENGKQYEISFSA